MSDATPQYTVLARRFRPQSFSDVIGQDHVGQAIQNAIRGGRVAHAYLFTGARGVGKTSTARIFAKALNCPNMQDGVPCNQCDICQGIGAGNDVDVLEIDGASNRGIDDVRQLRANVNIRSMRSPYKVYIIDEVHMLTKEAFNALLKTLEEPPPNVKFVFCTTEPQKVPDTILSRCQRFDFGTIAAENIAARLKEIADAEGKQVVPEAIELIARRAAGSMRDSQSLFDQLLAFGGEVITPADVNRLLGTAPDDRMIELVEAAIQSQPGTALALIESSLTEGVQTGILGDQLLSYLRDLLVTAAGATSVPLSAVTETSRPRVQDQAQRWGLQTISAAMQILTETKAKSKWTNYGRALLELAVVRMASLEQLDNIASLAQQVSGGFAGEPAGKAPVRSQPLQALRDSFAKKKLTDGSPAAAAIPRSGEPRAEAPPPAATACAQAELDVPREVQRTDPVPVREIAEGAPPTEMPAAPVKPSPVVAPKGQPRELTADFVVEIWGEILRNVPDVMRSHLQNATKRAISGPNRLDILFPKSYLFSKSYCERPETRSRLVGLAGQFAGQPVECRFAIDDSASSDSRPAAKPKPKEAERLRNAVVDGDDFVQKAAGIFNAKVVEVKTILEAAVPASPEERDDD